MCDIGKYCYALLTHFKSTMWSIYLTLLFLRHPPNFVSRKVKKIGKCRTARKECEDCMTTDVSLIYNVHYTQCESERFKSIDAVPRIRRLSLSFLCGCWYVWVFCGITVIEGRKPWNCIGTGAPGGRIPGGKPATAIDTNAGNFGRFIS